MRPRVLLAIIAVAPLCFLLRGAGAYQHVTNGGFEDGLAGWSAAPTTDLAIAPADEMLPFEGAASARVTLGYASAVVRQRTSGALGPGAYTAQLQARATSAASLVLAVLPADTNQQIVAGSGDLTPAWTEVGGGFTLIEAADVLISITVSGAPDTTIYLDDVRIDGAPPVTLTPTFTASPDLPTATPEPGAPVLPGTATAIASMTATATQTPVVDHIAPELRNPGFEELDAAGLPFAWEKYGGVLSADARARSGTRAARLESSTDSTKWLHQAVTVGPGNWYAFDAWLLHNDAGIASAWLRVSWYASADASGSALAAADSTERLDTRANSYRLLTTGAIQAPQGAHSARVRVMMAPVAAAPASILVDDAWWRSTAPAPLPTATVAPLEDLEDAIDEAGPDGSSADVGRVSRVRSSGLPTSDRGVRDGAARGMIINEVLYDADANTTDPDAEWVELYNASEVSVDVGYWSLRDASGLDALPSIVVPPRGFAIIAATEAFRSLYSDVEAPVAVVGGRIGNALGNDGDRLALVDATGATVDAISWGEDASVLDPSIGDVPAGHSIERRVAGADTDTAADFVDNDRPSPGRAYEPAQMEHQSGNPVGDVTILEGSESIEVDWLPWAIAAASAASCVCVAVWRAGPSLLERLRRP